MDKQTLSNYGWIVVLVLILSVLLALASPLGIFVADGFKASYTGLFDVESSAMDVVMNATGGPIKDPALNPSKTIPEGGKYIEADGTEHTPGRPFPEEPQTGDRYEYGDYIYAYNQYPYNSRWETNESFNGWGADVKSSSSRKEILGALLESINNKPLTSINHTFYCCYNLKVAPEVPDSVRFMDYAFWDCESLTDEGMPKIPYGVESLTRTFSGCETLTDISDFDIPSSVKTLSYTFTSCYNLQNDGLPAIPYGVIGLGDTFAHCTSLTDTSALVLPESITSISGLFYCCKNLEIIPILPDSVTETQFVFAGCSALKSYAGSTDADYDFSNYKLPSNLKRANRMFMDCTSITKAPVIPETVWDLLCAFENCTALETAPIISNKVSDLRNTFENCTALTGVIEINTNTTTYEECFLGVDFEAQNIILTGTSTRLDEIGATGINYCTECNGKCQNNH